MNHPAFWAESGPRLAVMQRRAFLASLGLNVLAAPLAAGAQQTGKIPRIGILTTGFPDVLRHLLEAFKQGLHEHGYVEGHNVRLELRYAETKADRLPILAAELVRLNVDVIINRPSSSW